MNGETAHDKAANYGSLALKIPDLAARGQARRQTPHAASTADICDLAHRSLATGQVCEASSVKVSSSANTIEKPCHFMEPPAELRLVIYEQHFENILKSCEPRLVEEVIFNKLSSRYLKAANESVIKGALSFLHTSRTTRIEALPLYQALVRTVQDSMEAKLDQMGSGWRQGAGVFMWAEKQACPFVSRVRDLPRHKLEIQYDDVCDIYGTLQLVESNMFKRDLSVRLAKSRMDGGSLSYAEYKLEYKLMTHAEDKERRAARRFW